MFAWAIKSAMIFQHCENLMTETNIWWDNEQIKSLKIDKSYGLISIQKNVLGGIIPAGEENPGKIQLILGGSIPLSGVPYIQREPIVGDYVIFTNSSSTNSAYHGFITKVISKDRESLSGKLTFSPTTERMVTEIKTNRIQNNEIRFYTIDPEFVKAIGWGNLLPTKIEEKFTPLFSLIGKQ